MGIIEMVAEMEIETCSMIYKTNNVMKAMAEETVFLNRQNYIEMIFPERLELETLEEMLTKAEMILSGLRNNNNSPALLVDVTLLKKLSSSSRQKGTAWIQQNKNLRIAIYGKNTFMKHFVNFLVIATRRSATMKFFITRKAAEEWLKSIPN
jgi:hypothetical protein